VPDLTNFELKPYVSYKTPRVSRDILDQLKQLNDYSNDDNLKRYRERGNRPEKKINPE